MTLWGLIACNLIWSFNPVMGKILLQIFHPVHAAALRYVSSALAYFVFAMIFLPRDGRYLLPRQSGFVSAIFLGVVTFGVTPILQTSGLMRSAASQNAILIALEPLFAVALAWWVAQERPRSRFFVAAAGALLGFVILNLRGFTDPTNASTRMMLGNALIVLSLLGEGLYSALGRKLVGSTHAVLSPYAVFGTAITTGALLNAVLTLMMPLPTPGFFVPGAPSPEIWIGAALWLGPLATTLTYLFWMRALVQSSVANSAMTLFIQPVFGAWLGVTLLDEKMTPLQWAGSLLVVFSVALYTVKNPWPKIRNTFTGS